MCFEELNFTVFTIKIENARILFSITIVEAVRVFFFNLKSFFEHATSVDCYCDYLLATPSHKNCHFQ